jgi:hypothetical protein
MSTSRLDAFESAAGTPEIAVRVGAPFVLRLNSPPFPVRTAALPRGI